MIFSAFIAAYIGFAALSLSKNRHYQQVWPQAKLAAGSARIWQILGWLCLVISGSLFIYLSGIGIGLVQMLGFFTLAALLVVIKLSYFPNYLLGIGLINFFKISQ